MATHVYTSVAANYLPKARVLAESIKTFHPDWIIHLVLCDKSPEWLSTEGEPFDRLLTLEDLQIPDLTAWKFKHDLVELSTAAKGFALQNILNLPDCAEVFYFDPDVVVLSSLAPLVYEFKSASLLLTPHLTEPENTQEAIVDNELSALQHGIYNLGFIGVKNSDEGRRFASWWRDRLQEFCYDNIPGGLFTDQRWADLIPAYFPDHKVLRDPGYNVATWNLTHRNVAGSLRDGLWVNGKPLVFFHFSGFDSGAQQRMLNKYGSAMPALFELRDWYQAACEHHGQEQLSQAPWSYDSFENGEPILPAHRRRYREQPELSARFPNPYATETENQSYLHWYNWHSGNRLLSHESTDLPSCAPAPSYQIFLIGAPGDAEYIPDSMVRLSQNSFQRSQFFLVVSQDFEIQFPLPPSWEVLRCNSTRYEDLFAAVVETCSEKDLLITRAGIVPPPYWDLRLAWSAARGPSILTVSPLDRRALDPAGTLSGVRDEELDELCYWLREENDPETASFLADCVYLRAAALREIANGTPPLKPMELTARAARFRYSHRLATHVCCAWHPPPRMQETVAAAELRPLRDALRSYALFPQPTEAAPVVSRTMTAPTLHVIHSWGGGVEQWLRDYSEADDEHENLVLQSFGQRGAYGRQLRLYRYGSAEPELLRSWTLEPAITATAVFHESYRKILAQIRREFQFGQLLVSSLIGHALECLRLSLPVVFVCHDYYPFCSAVNLTFGEVCRSCEKGRLQACLEGNVHNRFFPNVGASEWLTLRGEFLRAVRESRATFVAPSPSVRENYSRVLPELASLFTVIPHGADNSSRPFLPLRFLPERPLRVVIIGSLAVHKGRLLLESILPELLQFAEITLLGCYDFPDTFAENMRIRVIPAYEPEELPKWIAELEPEVNLLLSVVPETFSYILREMQDLGVPSLATRLGSFSDWIDDGVTGFLCAPEPREILSALRNFAHNKRPLECVHQKLRTLPARSAKEMVSDYARLIPACPSPERYFYGPKPPAPVEKRHFQLYWRAPENNFSEDNSFTAMPRGTGRQLLRLYLPGQKQNTLHELRLDLSRQAGFLSLHRVTLLDFRDEPVWSWNGEFSLWETVKSAQIVPIWPREGQSGIPLYLTGNDPWLILPVPAPLLKIMERGGSVTIDFTIGKVEDYTLDLISAQLQATAQARSLGEELYAKHGRLAETEQSLKISNAQITAFQNSLSWRVTKPLRAAAKLGRKILAVPRSDLQSPSNKSS